MAGENPPGVCRRGLTYAVTIRLGFNPVAVVQWALAIGLIKPAPGRDVTRGGRGVRYATEAERIEAKRAAKRRYASKEALT